MGPVAVAATPATPTTTLVLVIVLREPLGKVVVTRNTEVKDDLGPSVVFEPDPPTDVVFSTLVTVVADEMVMLPVVVTKVEPD